MTYYVVYTETTENPRSQAGIGSMKAYIKLFWNSGKILFSSSNAIKRASTDLYSQLDPETWTIAGNEFP